MLHKFFNYLLKNQVVFALVLVTVGWFILQTRGILASIFIAYIIMAALLPIVKFLHHRGLPNFVASVITYIGLMGFLVLIIIPLFQVLGSQIQTFFENLPRYLNESATTLGFNINAKQIQDVIAHEGNTVFGSAFTVTSRVFGGVFSTLTIVIVSFYLLLYHRSFKHAIANLFHNDSHEQVFNTISQVEDKLGAWLRGQVALSLIIWLITWIILSILGVPFALPLAILAGLLEIVPTLGPIMAAIPAAIVALTISPTLALTVIAAYIIIQLLENNVLVPKIMERAVGLNPVIVIIAVAIGANLLGVVGALLSIPFVSFLTVLFASINANYSTPAKKD